MISHAHQDTAHPHPGRPGRRLRGPPRRRLATPRSPALHGRLRPAPRAGGDGRRTGPARLLRARAQRLLPARAVAGARPPRAHRRGRPVRHHRPADAPDRGAHPRTGPARRRRLPPVPHLAARGERRTGRHDRLLHGRRPGDAHRGGPPRPGRRLRGLPPRPAGHRRTRQPAPAALPLAQRAGPLQPRYGTPRQLRQRHRAPRLPAPRPYASTTVVHCLQSTETRPRGLPLGHGRLPCPAGVFAHPPAGRCRGRDVAASRAGMRPRLPGWTVPPGRRCVSRGSASAARTAGCRRCGSSRPRRGCRSGRRRRTRHRCPW